MSYPSSPKPLATGLESSDATGGRLPAYPAMPRWLHPSIRVRQQSGVVCVEQHVPARVAQARTVRRDIDGHAGGPKFIRTIRRYESGLSGDPSGLPLVRERLTVPLPAAGTSDAVNREVTRRLASFRPSRGASPITSLPPARFFIRLVFTIMLICFIIGACALTVGAARDLLGAPGANTAIALMLITVMSLATVGLTVLGIVIARHTWLMRTPQWLAEDQWQLLRRTLMEIARQEPGSSRPLDVELGRRRDLITHPGGGRAVPGLTRAGLPGPVWPDQEEVNRAVRRARRGTAGRAVILVLALALAALILALPVSMGLFSPAPLPLLAYGVLGLFICIRLKRSDSMILSRPRTVPGDHRPIDISPDRVDVPSLPAWCQARKREDRWNALALLHGLLAAVVLISQVLVAIVLNDRSLIAGGSGIGPAAVVIPLAAFALTGGLGAWWGARWVRNRDMQRLTAAGMP